MNRPTMPCASVPPITPMKMTIVGVVSPRPIDERLQYVVQEADDDQEQRQQGCRGEILVEPDPDDHRKQDDCGTDLHDRQDHDDKGQQAGAGDAGHFEADAGKQGLDDRNADDALGYCADGGACQIQKMFGLIGGDATEKSPARRREL